MDDTTIRDAGFLLRKLRAENAQLRGLLTELCHAADEVSIGVGFSDDTPAQALLDAVETMDALVMDAQRALRGEE